MEVTCFHQLNRYSLTQDNSTNTDSMLFKPPEMPGENDCCREDCANCVWLMYALAVKCHFKGDGKEIQKALNSIPHPETRAFIEMELKKEYIENS
ncbi:hypothetical protein CEXT_306581 [Caerostris extrusa]|uniref:Oxidoreductase-like domain-containing protein n=1 Tax=Caerostris extrusa TaxID=172846 RepID=A0AAV4NKL5_CAEEX|nr:hypothetical protein CEXT_306581 [Caerostris extrusa]